ncbi:MAG: GTPase [Bdellovibrionales bacterium]
MIRDSLGEDAIIVATREDKSGGGVNVTAAIDNHRSYDADPAFEVSKNQTVAKKEDWLQYDDEEENRAVMEVITEAMIGHGVPEDVTDQILTTATIMGLEEPHIALLAALEDTFKFETLFDVSNKNHFLFVGPAGAGKTLTVAKFAANAVMDGKDVVVMTADTERAGGVEQLKAFTDIMDVELVRVTQAQELADKINEFSDADYIFVDMPGLNPYNPRDINTIDDYIQASACEPVLVLPAATDPYESEDLAKIYKPLGIKAIIPTRLDMARRYGGLLSTAYAGNLSFVEAGISQNVAGGLDRLTPKKLAKYLIPNAESKDQNT